MSEISMKKDLQEALAEGVMKYSANYDSLIFNKENAYMIQSLFFMKNINISIVDNNFRFDIELDEQIKKLFTNNDIKAVQKRNMENKTVDSFLDEFEKNFKKIRNNFIIENALKEDEDINDIEISLKEKQIFNEIKFIFKLNANINLKEKYNGKYFSLSAHQKEVKLNKTILNLLVILIQENVIDILIISPYFMNQDGFEGENISGVTIYMGIDKKQD